MNRDERTTNTADRQNTMNGNRHADRRTVLKTIGAGVAGGAVLTGTAGASSGGRTDIYLRGHHFTPKQANVRLGGEGGSATIRWTNDEVNYFGKGYPIPHDVHLHHGHDHLVESGLFVQERYFKPPEAPPGTPPIDLGPTFYEVEFREEGSDLVIEETSGKVASKGFDTWPPIQLIEEYDSATIEDWGGSVTIDVHCSLHSIALEVDEDELVSGKREIEPGDAPYGYRVGFFKMDGGLTITR